MKQSRAEKWDGIAMGFRESMVLGSYEHYCHRVGCDGSGMVRLSVSMGLTVVGYFLDLTVMKLVWMEVGWSGCGFPWVWLS